MTATFLTRKLYGKILTFTVNEFELTMPVYIKNNGIHYCVYYNGAKRVWESFGRGPEAKKAAEVRDLEIKLKKKRDNWYVVQGGNTTFSDVANAYLDSRYIELSESTVQSIFMMLNKYILPKIGAKQISAVTIHDWNLIQKKIASHGAGNRTINTYFHYLNKIFRWTVTNNYLADNPWKNREILKQKKFKIELFTVEEFQKILNAAPDHLAWAMEVAYYTGARPGPKELFALQWKNCDFDGNRIRIYATKTDTWRWQYVPEKFMERMKKRYEESRSRKETSPYVITYLGEPVKSLKTAWKKAKEKAGVRDNIRLYDIRHFYITHALANGASILELAERVGHVDATMIIKIYAHLVEELKIKQAYKIPDIHFPTPAPDKIVDETVDEIKKGLTSIGQPLDFSGAGGGI